MAEPFVPRWVRCHPDGELREAEGLSCLAEGAHSRLYKRSLIATPSGRLPDDDGTLARYCGLGLTTWRKVRAELEAAGLWKRDRVSVFCPRARAELKVCAERYGKAQKAGKTAASKRLQNQEVPSVSPALAQQKNFHKTDGTGQDLTEKTDGRTEGNGRRGVDRTDGTDLATPSVIRNSGDSSSGAPPVSPPDSASPSVPSHTQPVGNRPPRPGGGFSSAGQIVPGVMDHRQKTVAEVLRLATQLVTGRDLGPPDPGIVEQVIEASGYATADEIEQTITGNARSQGKREIKKYAYWIPVVRESRDKARGGTA